MLRASNVRGHCTPKHPLTAARALTPASAIWCYFSTLTRLHDFAMFAYGFFRRVPVKRRTIRTSASSHGSHKLMKKKTLKASKKKAALPPDPDAPAKQAQLKFYEEGLKHFQQQ